MKLHHRILLPHVLAGVLLLVSGFFFANDARTVIEAEEIEEDLSGMLVLSGSYINSLQRSQLLWHQYLRSGGTVNLERFRQESERSGNRLQALLAVVSKDFRQAQPLVQPLAALQHQFAAQLNDTDEPAALFRIQLILDQLEADIKERRLALNNQVAFSVRRAEVAIGVVVAVLMAILALGYTVVVRALARNRQLRRQLEEEATHDPLTQLPNRRYFLDWIARTTAEAQRHGDTVALFYLDLDGFKAVNDHWGHAAGDEVLRVVSRRLQGVIRESDLLFRLGGDEFALVVNHAGTREQLATLAQRLLDSTAPSIPLGPEQAHVGVSIGIALHPDDAQNHTELLRAADNAMYQAKQRGKNGFCFCSTAPAPLPKAA